MSNPKGLRYTKDHEWIRVEGEIAYVGITDHAQEALGDIVYVEVPEIERELHRGEEASNIESVKAAEPVYAPLTGKVVEVNESLDATPELINQKPFETHIFALRIAHADEVETLLSADDYDRLLAEEEEG